MDAVAQALADPIRRDILRRLREGALTAGAIAAGFAVSRPAVSRHLRVLREAQLVRDVARGREREYRLSVAALDELQAFIAELRAPAEWERRFAALETEVYRVRQQRRRAGSQVRAESTPKPKKETA